MGLGKAGQALGLYPCCDLQLCCWSKVPFLLFVSAPPELNSCLQQWRLPWLGHPFTPQHLQTIASPSPAPPADVLFPQHKVPCTIHPTLPAVICSSFCLIVPQSSHWGGKVEL